MLRAKGKQKLTEAQMPSRKKKSFPPSRNLSPGESCDPAFVKKFSESIFRNVSIITLRCRLGKHGARRRHEHPPFWKWFVGRKLNACYNCVDRT